MAQFFSVHPEQPQLRLIKQAAEIMRKGGLVAFPTDSAYALGGLTGDNALLARIRRIRGVDERHHFTLICRDLSDLATYARVDNSQYRLLKATTPGPYTFILTATREVPRMLLHEKRRTIGLRVPAHPLALALTSELGEPLMSVSLILPGETLPMSDPYEMRQILEHQVDLIIDGGFGGLEASTVVSLLDDSPEVLRVGAGDPTPFEND